MVGAIAELGGAVGVVLSLIYLARQIRTQNVESRLNSVSNLTAQYNAFLGDLATDSDLAETFLKGVRDFGALDDLEVMQFSSHFGRTFRIYEGLFFHHVEGRLDTEIWTGIEASLEDLCTMPGIRDWWRTRSRWYSKRFQSFLRPMVERKTESTLYAIG